MISPILKFPISQSQLNLSACLTVARLDPPFGVGGFKQCVFRICPISQASLSQITMPAEILYEGWTRRPVLEISTKHISWYLQQSSLRVIHKKIVDRSVGRRVRHHHFLNRNRSQKPRLAWEVKSRYLPGSDRRPLNFRFHRRVSAKLLCLLKYCTKAGLAVRCLRFQPNIYAGIFSNLLYT